MAFEGIRNMLEVAHGKHCACGFCGEANAELAAVEALLNWFNALPEYGTLPPHIRAEVDKLLSPQGDGPKEPRT